MFLGTWGPGPSSNDIFPVETPSPKTRSSFQNTGLWIGLNNKHWGKKSVLKVQAFNTLASSMNNKKECHVYIFFLLFLEQANALKAF